MVKCAKQFDIIQLQKYTYMISLLILRKITTRNDYLNNITGQLVYGESQPEPVAHNLRDKLYRLTEATGREHVNNGADTGVEIDGYPNVSSPIPSDAAALRNYTRKWEYDDVGNILKLIHNANNGNWNRVYNYAPNNNRLMSTVVGSSTVNYTYNAHGSMASMPHLHKMEWDFAERLAHVKEGSTDAHYNYDISGERVRKVVKKGGIVETRLYLGGFEIFRKKSGNTLVLERETLHVMDDTRRIALVETLTVENSFPVTETPVLRYQLGNNIESAALELDENASIISYEEYYPYGDTSYQAGRSTSEVSQKRYRYTGKEKDDESGFYYHGARYYACWLGRWTAADPAGLVDGVNLYAYCRGNPVLFTDSTGMFVNRLWDGVKSVENATVGEEAAGVEKNIGEVAGKVARFVGGAIMAAIGSSIALASIPFSWIPGSGFITQLGVSIAAYGGIMAASVFDDDIKADMEAIGWDPFNINEATVNNSNKVSWYRGMPVFLTGWSRSGSFFAIILSRYNLETYCRDNPDTLNEDWDPWILRHEWGHGVQAWQLGALWYGLFVGIPSIANWNERKVRATYYNARGEKDADTLGGVKRDKKGIFAVLDILESPAPRVRVTNAW
jgi:RHS repeat-associated protein